MLRHLHWTPCVGTLQCFLSSGEQYENWSIWLLPCKPGVLLLRQYMSSKKEKYQKRYFWQQICRYREIDWDFLFLFYLSSLFHYIYECALCAPGSHFPSGSSNYCWGKPPSYEASYSGSSLQPGFHLYPSITMLVLLFISCMLTVVCFSGEASVFQKYHQA